LGKDAPLQKENYADPCGIVTIEQTRGVGPGGGKAQGEAAVA